MEFLCGDFEQIANKNKLFLSRCFFQPLLAALGILVDHTVTNPQLIEDIIVAAGAAAQLFADVCHVDLQLFGAAAVGITPDGLDDGGVGHHAACVGRQKGHDVELRLGQLDLLPGHKHLAALVVDLQILGCERPG